MPTYQWLDEHRYTIKAIADDGSVRFIPSAPDNIDYAKIVEEGIEIEEPPTPPKEEQ